MMVEKKAIKPRYQQLYLKRFFSKNSRNLRRRGRLPAGCHTAVARRESGSNVRQVFRSVFGGCSYLLRLFGYDKKW